jgi:hypothetical protein
VGVYSGPTNSWINLSTSNSLNGLVKNGLILALDAGRTLSYPGSGTTWNDLSGNGANATLVNGPAYSSENGGYINFDGANDYASVAISLLSSSMTVEITFRINASGSFDDIAVLDDGTNQIMFELGGFNTIPNTNGHLRYYANYAGGVGDITNSLASSSQYILDSRIHTSVLTVGSSLATSYFDGVSQGSGSVTENKTFTRLVLGNDLLRVARACNCRIYQVKIYNRALTESEVQQNYNTIKSRYGL